MVRKRGHLYHRESASFAGVQAVLAACLLDSVHLADRLTEI